MAFKGVHLLLDVSQVPGADRLVSRSSGNEDFRGRVEGQGVDGVKMPASGNERCLGCLALSNVDDLQRLIIGDCANEALGDGMVLNIVDDLGVVRVTSSRPQRLRLGLECFQIPAVVLARCLSDLSATWARRQLTIGTWSCLRFPMPGNQLHEDSS